MTGGALGITLGNLSGVKPANTACKIGYMCVEVHRVQ
jgi:hypothetical protein